MRMRRDPTLCGRWRSRVPRAPCWRAPTPLARHSPSRRARRRSPSAHAANARRRGVRARMTRESPADDVRSPGLSTMPGDDPCPPGTRRLESESSSRSRRWAHHRELHGSDDRSDAPTIAAEAPVIQLPGHIHRAPAGPSFAARRGLLPAHTHLPATGTPVRARLVASPHGTLPSRFTTSQLVRRDVIPRLSDSAMTASAA